MHAQVARDFEQNIAKEKQACREAVLRRRHMELGVHGQRGIADVGAVELVRDIHHDHERCEPPGDPFHQLIGNCRFERANVHGFPQIYALRNALEVD
jgi:hypothetical protein